MNHHRLVSPSRRLSWAAVAAAVFLGAEASAEQCPANQPSWLSGRLVVFEQNLSPPRLRGVGDVLVYAYQQGHTPPGLRRMAVTDGEGHFCIHDTAPGPWVVTAFEPFMFRPFVRELGCSGSSCSLGEVKLDGPMVRISDDFVDYQPHWYGGPFAQTVTMPAGARNITRITFRSGGGSTNEVKLFAGQTVSGSPVATAGLFIPPQGGRGDAVFQPGAAAVSPSSTYTVLLSGASAPWRLTGGYPAGAMFGAGGGVLTAITGEDLCLAIDLDGADGNLTSFLVGGSGSYVYAGTVAQSFIARSPEITYASVVSGTPAGFRRIQASISATRDGPPIGPVRETIGLDQQGVAFAWFGGEVPVTVGSRYFIRFHFPEGGRAVYTRQTDPLGQPPYPAGQLFADGAAQAGSIWGRVLGSEVASPVIPTGPWPGSDAGSSPAKDAGVPVAPPDAGGETKADAGRPAADAGKWNYGVYEDEDGGTVTPPAAAAELPGEAVGGCGCGAGGGVFAWLALLGLAARRRRSPAAR